MFILINNSPQQDRSVLNSKGLAAMLTSGSVWTEHPYKSHGLKLSEGSVVGFSLYILPWGQRTLG